MKLPEGSVGSCSTRQEVRQDSSSSEVLSKPLELRWLVLVNLVRALLGLNVLHVPEALVASAIFFFRYPQRGIKPLEDFNWSS